MTDAKRVILFRHGETDWNKAGLIQGHTDNPLNETGIRQAESLADVLKGEGVQHIFSSPLRRAALTGQIVAARCNAPVSLHAELEEIDFGIGEGQPRSEMREKFPAMYDLLGRPEDPRSCHVGFPDGETRQQVFNRASGAIQGFLQDSKLQVVGISTHGEVIGSILAVAFKKCSSVQPCQLVEVRLAASDSLRLYKQ
jgi:broad specificity phosphatase PhoE